jgi:hypothetical protein
LDSLKDIFNSMAPSDGDVVPDDGICAVCDRLVRDHPGVEKLLAARGLKYWDEGRMRMVVKAGIPYCRCDQGVEMANG